MATVMAKCVTRHLGFDLRWKTCYWYVSDDRCEHANTHF